MTTMLLVLLQFQGIVLDDSPTRVETDLKVEMEIMGTLRPKSVSEISSSRWTLDCGGMDREHADWRAVRGYVAPLGIARIRQQAIRQLRDVDLLIVVGDPHSNNSNKLKDIAPKYGGTVRALTGNSVG